MTKRTTLTLTTAFAALALAAPAPAYNVFVQSSVGEINGNGAYPASHTGTSADGRHLFFETAERLTTSDTDSAFDIYDRVGNETVLVTPGGSTRPSFRGASADGSRVFFLSTSRLSGNDTDNAFDIYERSAGTTKRVTVGEVNGNGAYPTWYLRVSPDGTRVFFETAERLTSDDTDSSWDIYERSGGQTTRVSRGAVNGNGVADAEFRGISADGTHVFFETTEGLIAADTDGLPDVYERAGGTTRRISAGAINGNGPFAAKYAGSSADGSRVFFETDEQLVSEDADNNYQDVYARSADTTARVSTGEINGNWAQDAAFEGVSADGTHVVFSTVEHLTSDDTDGSSDLYVRSAGVTKRASKGPVNGNGAFEQIFRAISADGSHIIFDTSEALLSGDLDAAPDIYDRTAGTTVRISRGAINGNGHRSAQFVRASTDASHVFFESAEQLTSDDTDLDTDVYAWINGTTTRVSRGPKLGNGAFFAGFAGASADGSRVYIRTRERLSCNDTDAEMDIYGASTSIRQAAAELCQGPVVGGP
jgi:hypothetical protein